MAYFRQRQFARAILHFEQAGKISATYSIPADPVIDSLYHQSYKEWLLDRISREQRLIWDNQSDSAGNFLSLAMETAKSKGLEYDPEILKALMLYRSRITNHTCELMEDSLVLFNIRAGRCFEIHNITGVSGYYSTPFIRQGEWDPAISTSVPCRIQYTNTTMPPITWITWKSDYKCSHRGILKEACSCLPPMKILFHETYRSLRNTPDIGIWFCNDEG